MKKSFISLITSAIIIVLIITGCNSKNSLEGTWYYTSDFSISDTIYYTFNADKTGGYTYGGTTSKFKYENTKTTLKIQYVTTTIPNEFEYKIENDILIIKDRLGSDVTYKKK